MVLGQGIVRRPDVRVGIGHLLSVNGSSLLLFMIATGRSWVCPRTEDRVLLILFGGCPRHATGRRRMDDGLYRLQSETPVK